MTCPDLHSIKISFCWLFSSTSTSFFVLGLFPSVWNRTLCHTSGLLGRFWLHDLTVCATSVSHQRPLKNSMLAFGVVSLSNTRFCWATRKVPCLCLKRSPFLKTRDAGRRDSSLLQKMLKNFCIIVCSFGYCSMNCLIRPEACTSVSLKCLASWYSVRIFPLSPSISLLSSWLFIGYFSKLSSRISSPNCDR